MGATEGGKDGIAVGVAVGMKEGTTVGFAETDGIPEG